MTYTPTKKQLDTIFDPTTSNGGTVLDAFARILPDMKDDRNAQTAFLSGYCSCINRTHKQRPGDPEVAEKMFEEYEECMRVIIRNVAMQALEELGAKGKISP